MKTEKGITLISLIIYVIVMLIVVTIVGTVTSYFYANVNDKYEDLSKDEDNENILDMYLINDLKNKEIEATVSIDAKRITLRYEDDSYVIYTITDNGIYRNAVKIYNNTQEMEFILDDILSQDSIIIEKQKLEIQIIDEETVKTFKTYIINTKPRANYESNTVN